MRYVIAMACAVVGALLAARLLAIPLASWISRQFSYTNPTGQADVEQWSFLVIVAIGLVAGWAIGWFASAPLDRRRRARR